MPNDIVKSSMDNEIVRKLTWSAMLTVSSALASLLAARLAAVVYRRVFDEDPPD
jgi:hypothetical protein